MYRLAEKESGKKISPDEDQTKDAEKLWSQPNRPFGVNSGAKGDWESEG
jgi:hypothetical protein